jgi:UDP-N-acetylglucosamine 2-epimerase (non-hydrolysing)
MARDRIRRVDCIVGARPNFVKIAPIMRALGAYPRLEARLIHTGQHYDVAMNAVFFEELSIPEPDINLEVGSASNTEQTARVMLALEPVFRAEPPNLVLVVGDVNSTLAAALVAAQLNIRAAHVEAGLRSLDRTMPEETNRIVTDRLCELLFATERSGVDNLRREGVDSARVTLVGNVMIDTLHASLERAIPAETTFAELGASPEFVNAARRDGFGFVTLHRPSNVDEPAKLAGLVGALAHVSEALPLVFPLHPRTSAALTAAGLDQRPYGRLLTSAPLSYLRALGLMRSARLAITDSGGVQEETTALGIPCLTLRENTERPTTVEEGTNTVIGTSPAALIGAVEDVLKGGGKRGRIPALWDGKAARRIAERIAAVLD